MNLQTLANLSTLYNEPHRYYHNLNHIHKCLAEYEEYVAHQRNLNLPHGINDVVETSIWWHDAVYNPYSKFNELNSARLYECSVDSKERHWWFVDLIVDIIKSTAKHDVDQIFIIDDENSLTKQIVLDLDLSSLGSSTEEFKFNGENIRKEYAHVPDAIFYKARMEFLGKLWARKKIFYTEYFSNKYETKARENIMEEVERIREFFYNHK